MEKLLELQNSVFITILSSRTFVFGGELPFCGTKMSEIRCLFQKSQI